MCETCADGHFSVGGQVCAKCPASEVGCYRSKRVERLLSSLLKLPGFIA